MIIAPALDKCIGCQLCSFYSHILERKSLGFSQSSIKVDYNNASDQANFSYDPRSALKRKNQIKVAKICPRQCLSVVD